MKTFVKMCILATLCAFVKAGEPECSRFHYEEKTLEKMIKTEIFVDKIKTDTEMMKQKTLEKVNGIQEDWEKTKDELNNASAENQKVVDEIKLDTKIMQQKTFDKVTGIQKELEKTKNELNNASAENQKVVDEIKNKVDDLLKPPIVAFNAHDIKNTNPSNGETLIFSITTLDLGSGYNNVTGVFIAPVAGVYLFTFQLCIKDSRYIHFQIIAGETPILKGRFIDDGPPYYGCHSVSTVAVIDAGEHVLIKHVRSSVTDFWKYKDIWNSFSGALIRETTK